MSITLAAILTFSSISFGLLSAASWLYSAKVKVTTEKMREKRRKAAARKGETPSFAGVSLDGWDMSSTLEAQAKWSSIGATLAAISIGLQAAAQMATN